MVDLDHNVPTLSGLSGVICRPKKHMFTGAHAMAEQGHKPDEALYMAQSQLKHPKCVCT